MGFFTVPVGGKQFVGPVIVHGHARPEGHLLHQAVGADPLQVVGKPFPDIIQHRVVVPHIRQPVCFRVPKDQLRDRLPDAAQGVFAIPENPDDAENATAAAGFGENLAQGPEGLTTASI